MVSLFDPISTALETLKTIEGVGSHKPDPIRFRVRKPADPGAWAKRAAFQNHHDLTKWSRHVQARVTRTKSRMQPPHVIMKKMRGSADEERGGSIDTDVSAYSDKLKAKATHDEVLEETEEEEREIELEGFRQSRIASVKESLLARLRDEDDDDEGYIGTFSEEEDPEAKRIAEFSENQSRYWQLCQRIKAVASRRVLRNLDNFEMVLKMMKMTNNEFKALATALINNNFVQRLDLSECRMNDVQMIYLADLFSEETAITDLILADNLLGGRLMAILFQIWERKDCLVYLDISGNDLRDTDIDDLCPYVKDSSTLCFLYMARNKFTERVGDILGKLFAVNTSVIDLDISGNCIRSYGAEAFMKGIAKNTAIERLDFSWNGLGAEGCKGVAAMLKANSTLIYINLAGSRITGANMQTITTALNKNITLERIVLQNNPLLLSDITTFLTDLYKMATTSVKRVDFGSYQAVDESVVPLIDLLFWEKNIDIRYGSALSFSQYKYKDKDIISKFREDPLALVTRLKPGERMRLVKYFGQVDLDSAIETGEDIHRESFLYKMRNNKVTYKDLANRIMRAGHNPHDVITETLELSQISDPKARLVARFSLPSDIARRAYLKSRIEENL